mgnify:CR=1 FL=1
MRNRRLMILLFSSLLGILAFLWFLPVRFTVGHTPETTVEQMLTQMDGRLPKEKDADLHQVLNGKQSLPLYEVDSWKLEEVEFNDAEQPLLDDDPIYEIDVLLAVNYTDGDKALLQWQAWRYGLILGPFVISLGDGPPGYIRFVEHSND